MVLADLGAKLKNALKNFNHKIIIDEDALKECLNEIAGALMSSDVNIKYIFTMQERIKQRVKQAMKNDKGVDMRKLVQESIIDELTNLLDPHKKPYQFQKKMPNIVMFVGLQGAGKTTTCAKFAYFHKLKGWKVGLVCADTFRAGAYEQLRMNAGKVGVQFYGNKTETDPVALAKEGVDHFLDEKCQIIIVDTSGRHKQQDQLFAEMQQVEAAINPDECIFVMDSSIGQSCFDQAFAFREAVNVGSVIITKLDGHAKGGGALSAVAATQSPIVFIGTGEHFDEFDRFDPRSFIKRLLGLGDLKKVFREIQEAIPQDKQPEMMQRLQEGKFTLKDMKSQFESVLNLGNLNNLMDMIPGLNSNLFTKGKQKESIQRIKRFLYIMDSMTNQELDNRKPFNQSRVKRIAKGSGTSIRQVEMLLEQHKKFEKMVTRLAKGKMNKPGDIQNMMRNPSQMMKNLQSAVDPKILKQVGGAHNLMNMVNQFGKMEKDGGGDPDMMNMIQQMQGAAAGGGKGKKKLRKG